MEPFEESGLRFTPPSSACFRFADCETYRRMNGRQLSEMDVGYWDEPHQAIVLLELKDYASREPARALVPKLVAKGRDCLVMLHAVWTELGDTARDLRHEMPEAFHMQQKLRLFFVLKAGAEGISKEALTPMRGQLENAIKAYAELLGIRSLVVLLLDHEGAIRRGLPVSVVSE